jgi:integrase
LQVPGYNAEGLVFPESSTGLPWGPDRVSSLFYYQAHKLAVRITFHGLRHTHATVALRAGVPMKVVSDMLGRTTTAITRICIRTSLKTHGARPRNALAKLWRPLAFRPPKAD